MNFFPKSMLTSSTLSLLTCTLAIIVIPSSCKTTFNYLLNCGLPTTTVDKYNQTWTSDENPTFAPLAAYKDATTTAKATNLDPSSANQVTCSAARIFHSNFTYAFPVSPGPKFVRIHFCAKATYNNIYGDKFYLTLQANGGDASFTLLHNFSAYLHQQQFVDSFPGPVAKEFLVMATTTRLNLTFGPTSGSSSLPFVNGIEIVDVAKNLYDYFSPQSAEFTKTSRDRSHEIILNGLEIFKLSGSNGNLAGPNPGLSLNSIQPPDPKSSYSNGNSTRTHRVRIVIVVIGSVVLMVFAIVSAFCWWRMRTRSFK